MIAPVPTSGLVLLYHRIADLQPDVFGLCIRPDAFRKHMEHLAHAFRPMPLDELVAASLEDAIPDRAVAVTLDDGDLDALIASEILAEFDIPATFYLNTDRLGTPHENWYDVLERILISEEPVPDRFKGLGLDLPCDTPEARRAAFTALFDKGYALTAAERQNIVAAVGQWSRLNLAPRETHRLLTEPEVRILAARPAKDIGAHTVNHLFLPAHSEGTQAEEIALNKRALEALLDRPITTLAYPHGGFTAQTIDICRSLGFRSALTVVSAPLVAGADPLRVPRVEVKTSDLPAFEALLERRLSGDLS